MGRKKKPQEEEIDLDEAIAFVNKLAELNQEKIKSALLNYKSNLDMLPESNEETCLCGKGFYLEKDPQKKNRFITQFTDIDLLGTNLIDDDKIHKCSVEMAEDGEFNYLICDIYKGKELKPSWGYRVQLEPKTNQLVFCDNPQETMVCLNEENNVTLKDQYLVGFSHENIELAKLSKTDILSNSKITENLSSLVYAMNGRIAGKILKKIESRESIVYPEDLIAF